MLNQVYLLMLLLITICFSCKTSPSEIDSSVDRVGTSTTDEAQKTQALILSQPFVFDPADKNRITGDYISNMKITVPQNLAAQNKWLMFEGPVLENDLVAYRYYADSRHRFDVYGKTVSDMVMDTVGWQYHDIMDWGSDILKVGNSLGLGSPAIWYKDTLYTLSICEEKIIEIMDSAKNKSTIKTTFKNLNIEDKVFDVIQEWSIEAGKPWSEIMLKTPNGELPDGMSFATGIVKHLPEIVQGETEDYFYAMNWGKQSFHKENMGMAVLANKKYRPEHIVDQLSHAYAFKNGNSEVKYRFLSVWERDNNKVKDASQFKRIVEQSGR
jgi:hypothetical protein